MVSIIWFILTKIYHRMGVLSSALYVQNHIFQEHVSHVVKLKMAILLHIVCNTLFSLVIAVDTLTNQTGARELHSSLHKQLSKWS